MRTLKIREASFDQRAVLDEIPDNPTLEDLGCAVKPHDFTFLAEDNPDWLFVNCLVSRPGFTEFARKLELEHFPPDTEKNHEYQLVLTHWARMDWMTLAVPSEYEGLVRSVASVYGLVLKMGRRPAIILVDGIIPILGSFGDLAPLPEGSELIHDFPLPALQNVGVLESTTVGPVGLMSVIRNEGDKP